MTTMQLAVLIGLLLLLGGLEKMAAAGLGVLILIICGIITIGKTLI